MIHVVVLWWQAGAWWSKMVNVQHTEKDICVIWKIRKAKNQTLKNVNTTGERVCIIVQKWYYHYYSTTKRLFNTQSLFIIITIRFQNHIVGNTHNRKNSKEKQWNIFHQARTFDKDIDENINKFCIKRICRILTYSITGEWM